MATVNIWWIRRDLRLTDNNALRQALTAGQAVIPTFIIDPYLQSSPMVGDKRLAFLFAGLRSLDQALRQRGSYLVIRQGKPLEELAALIQQTGARNIFAERDFSPYAKRRDEAIAQELPLHLIDGLTVFPPDSIIKSNGEPYTVYTPFRRRWSGLPMPDQHSLLQAPAAIQTPHGIMSLPIPSQPALSDQTAFVPGEDEALRKLEQFISGREGRPIDDYADGRNRLDQDGTSRLSPYLRFGMLSARQAVVAAASRRVSAGDDRSKEGANVWLNELVWREFYITILNHFPYVLRRSFRPAYDQVPWRNDPDEFDAWCAGTTGYPVVDAAMRQLQKTGWMHNRARMIVASFLVKDLLVDWRWGERWFMQHLLDGDPAANNGGWQWVAGTGTDAAPYFRIFNPVLQGKKFDPEGKYVRHWLPELAQVPRKYIHEPWTMPASIQAEAACRIGHDYPVPIVDHAVARQATLAAYAQARESHQR